ncbi:hypothetical protein G6L16_018645 [Agrobacterium tumefaciens]|uniref:hypothetical protein n=1 Tax=Agrobacterium tumefaciens TaxID=358 RepID=UPI001572A6FB|nr:hypothetical protein [Agrobacterium tumefaciens]NSZ65164.1 hypothetical protein [Agrobacterium tumefaciens]NTA71535.1 hypothetical protein [Agrobacterium tumefaciens]WIE40235.1 hypothetical protein G6L16_018645 [Agrobacterium tumefaciens]
MSAPALVRKQDLLRAAEVANSTGCRIEIKIGDVTITVVPKTETEEAGIDYSRPSL